MPGLTASIGCEGAARACVRAAGQSFERTFIFIAGRLRRRLEMGFRAGDPVRRLFARKEVKGFPGSEGVLAREEF